MRKASLFKGLSATLGCLLPVVVIMSNLAFSRKGDIDNFLGIKGESRAQTSFSSPYSTPEELLKAEEDYSIRTLAEGSVLLRNENKALPLSGKKVTLFGNASVNPAYHGGSGGPSNSGVNLYDALKAEGFSINDVVYNKIKSANVTRGNGNIGEVDASIYNSGDIGEYKDAAIVTICRYGGEENDVDVKDSYGVRELALHDQEREMLEFVKAQGFGKVIVLLNSGYAMETGWLRDYCDAALWIAFPGKDGFKGVAKMLTGEINPSGRLVDVWAEHSFSSPAMQNFGDFAFTDLPKDPYHYNYLVYAEGIYVGYKYYETRYHDLIKGIHNASSAKGVYASTGDWNYASEVAYPFGFGLSYASFTEEVQSIEWDRAAHKVSASVKVTNTSSSVKAKRAVELYVSSPYVEGGLEKSAIQLIGFGKTAELEPGASEVVEIEAKDYLFASYDENATNGADSTKKGCYVFDAGDYYFSVGTDAHDALNNVLASSGSTNLYDHDGNPTFGKANNAIKVNLAERDNTSHAKNEVTGHVVSNLFQDIDINHLITNKITYLTRSDWNTFPDRLEGLKADDDPSGLIRKYMTAFESLYVKPDGAPDFKSFLNSQEDTIAFYELASLEFDDPKWETFIDQLTVPELTNIIGEVFGFEAITHVGYPKNSAGDGPDGLQEGGYLHPSETLTCASYNVELAAERGKMLAYDALEVGYSVVYGGGCNLHRTPYGGRNFEYYSEDANLSYYMGRAQAKAMSEGGLIGTFKHFLGNDQETNRHGVATFMSEQALREGDARAFEGALTDGGALGNMGAYNRIGVYATSSHKPLMTSLLRDEWGFKGQSMTDSSKDAKSYIFTADAVDAGTTEFNNDIDRPTEMKNLLRTRDGHLYKCLRDQAKYFFYSFSRSNAINGLGQETVVVAETSWWVTTLYVLEYGLIGLTSLAVIGYVAFLFFERKNGKGDKANA